MPADIITFDMLRLGTLQAMTIDELKGELARAVLMQARVNEYASSIVDVVRSKLEPAP